MAENRYNFRHFYTGTFFLQPNFPHSENYGFVDMIQLGKMPHLLCSQQGVDFHWIQAPSDSITQVSGQTEVETQQPCFLFLPNNSHHHINSLASCLSGMQIHFLHFLSLLLNFQMLWNFFYDFYTISEILFRFFKKVEIFTINYYFSKN